MKKLIITMLAFILLSGCVSFAPTYDNNEYYLFTKVNAEAKVTNQNCDTEYVNSNLNSLNKSSTHLITYTKNKNNNNNAHKIAKIIKKNINQLINNYKENQKENFVVYCKIKTDNISKMSQKASKIVEQKKR